MYSIYTIYKGMMSSRASNVGTTPEGSCVTFCNAEGGRKREREHVDHDGCPCAFLKHTVFVGEFMFRFAIIGIWS